MVDLQLAGRGISNRLVLGAFRQVPREHFVPPELAGLAYRDAPLPIGEEQTIEVSGFFAAIGHSPATDLFKGQVEMDEGGYVLQKENTMTSVPGVFAAGDVSDTRYRQAVTAAGDGCRAAIDSERWLEEQGEAEGAEDPAGWTAEKDVANL